MTEFERALHECLEALREGRADVDTCLRFYPEHAATLRPYLLVADAVERAFAEEPDTAFAADARERFLIASGQRLHEAFDVRPSDDFTAAARQRYLTASGQRLTEAFDVEPSPSFFAAARVKFLMTAHRMRQGAAVPRRALPLFGTPVRALMTAGLVMAAFFGFSTYTVASAASALPGDWRYPVKLQTERVRLALAFTDGAKRDVQLDRAEERASEVEELAAKGRIIPPGVLDRLTDQTQPLIDAAANDELDNGELSRLRSVTTRQETVLEQASPAVAPEALPKLAEAREVARRGAVISAVKLVNTSVGPPVITPDQPLVESPTPDPDAGSPTPDASETADAQPTATPQRGGLEIDDDPVVTANGVSWVRLAVGGLSTLIPSEGDGWQILGVSAVDGSSPAPALARLSNRDGTSLITLNPRNGDMYWFVAINGVFDEVQMRAAVDGETFVVDREVIISLYGPLADIPLFVLDHIELAPPVTATPTPEPPTPTPTPQADEAP